MLVLWWVGLGIEPHRNDPCCPQQNATVECLQGICARWVCPAEQPSVEAFQQALDEELRIQREVYRLTRKKNMTRMELFPELAHNPRRFNPKDFCWNKVKQYLADQVWIRTVSSHLVRVFGQTIYIGKQFAGQKVTIIYDPIEEKTIIRTMDGRLIKTSENSLVTESEILDYANMSKN